MLRNICHYFDYSLYYTLANFHNCSVNYLVFLCIFVLLPYFLAWKRNHSRVLLLFCGCLYFPSPGPFHCPQPWPWPPLPVPGPCPQFVFTGPGTQFVFTGPGPQFLFTSPGLRLYYQSRPWVCIYQACLLNL